VREGDGALTAIPTQGMRLCGMQPLTGAEQLPGDETTMFFTRSKLWRIRVATRPRL